MRKILFAFVLSIFNLLAAAQPGCPNITASSQTLPCGTSCTNLSATYFNVGSTNTYDVTSIPYAPPFPYYTGTPVLVRIDDTWSSVITLPFNFCFFGVTYNQLIIGSNGAISFDVSNAGGYNTWPISGPVPANTPTDLDASIMGVWEDIDPTNRGSITYQIGGSYPCHYFKVSYDSIPYYGDSHSVSTGICGGAKWASSEIVLYETTNVIEIYIREKQLCTGWNGGLAIEGIVDPTSTIAYTVPGRNATQWTASNDAYRFTPTSSSIVAVNWAQGGTVLCTGTGDTAIGNQTLTCHVCPPSSPTTAITTPYTATAVYTRCDGSTVTETANITITTTPSPAGGPDQNLGCYVPGLVATMGASAFGGGTWTTVPGNPSSTTITSPSSPTTTITGFTTAGTYTYLWGSGSCFDTVLVIITNNSNAGPDQHVNCALLPGGTATMAATGTGTWTMLSNSAGSATITTPTSPTTTITGFTVPGTYNFQWANGTCKDTAAVIVTAKPNAGPDDTVSCYPINTTATMAATGTGTWSAQTGNPGTATITTPSSPTTTITSFSAPGTYYYIWTNGSCTDTAAIVVTYKPNAGPDQNVLCAMLPGGSATMAATGTGTWTAQTGNPGTATITNTTSATTTITNFSAAGTYYYIWTNGSCSDTAAIVVTAKPSAGPDQTLSCITLPGGPVTMAGVGTGTWTASASNPSTPTITTPTSPTTTITNFTAAGTYLFIWTNGSCADTAIVTVTVKPNAGADQTIVCYPAVSLATMSATGAGTWSAAAGNPGNATITTPTSPTTTITGYTAAGLYYFIWTNASGCADTATVDVTIKPNAGPDQTVTCAPMPGGSATMAAVGTGTWSAMAGNPGTATITTPGSPTTTITGFTAPGTYSFVWTVVSCTDTANVVVTAIPNAGPDQIVPCVILPGGSATMATTGTGTWTAQAGNPSAVITNSTNPTTTITNFATAGTYHFIWTNSDGCVDTMAINVTAKPNAGPDKTINCAILPGGSTSMSAIGTGSWSAVPGNPGTANIVNVVSPTTVINTFTAEGVYYFTWTNALCSDTAAVTVTAKPNAGPDQTVNCAILPGGSTPMAAVGAGTWHAQSNNPGTATISDTTVSAPTISNFSAAGVYNFIWTSLSGCPDTASVTVTAKPNAGPDQTVSCALLPGGTATMGATGTGTWSPAAAGNPGTAVITSPSNALTTITSFSAAGTYSFVWTNSSGCTDTALIVVTQEPTVTLPNAAYCLGDSATLTPTSAPAGGSYLWSTGAVTPTINVSAASISYITVTYTLGSCSASASDTVKVNPLPTSTVTTIPSVCTASNGIAIANPAAGTPGYIYSWSSPGGTRDSISGLAPGTYTVTVTDINHCTVTASGTVGIQTPAIAVTEVSQHDLRCYNDASGEVFINLTDTARNSGSYIYVFNWSNGTHNQNLTGAQANTYTVTVTDQFGCTGSGTYTLTQPTALSATTAFTNPHCFGYSDGTASVVNPSGGSGSYHYLWSTNPVQNTQQATGLHSGTYTVALSDDSLCVLTLTVTLTDPLAITFAAPTLTNPLCYGDSNGTALVAPQNGIGTYTFAWSYASDSTNPVTGLPDGTYTVTATDANGCTGSSSITLVQPAPVTVSITPTNVKCFAGNDGSALAAGNGGTPPYAYHWNNGDSTALASTLVAGGYSVTATDNNGCSASNTTTINQPTIVSETLSSVRTNCPDSKDGSVTAIGNGGTGSFSYTLEDAGQNILQSGNTSGTFTGLGYGIYYVVTTDQNNCPATDTISVPRAPFNYYTSSADTVSCYGPQYHDGIIHVQGYTIPNGPFMYSVDGSAFQSIPDFFDLAAGPHQVTAQDNYGCDTTFTVTVGEPLPAVVQILPGDSTITAGTALQLSSTFGPYPLDSVKSYVWTPVTGLNCTDCPGPTASPYANQTDYTLVVTYNRGCIATASIRINVNGTPPVYIPDAFTPNGDGVNDVWSIFGTGIKDIKATVFNRWGEKVYESTNQSDGWDGTYRGQLQPPGVYVYVVEVVFLSDEKMSRQGSLSLIR